MISEPAADVDHSAGSNPNHSRGKSMAEATDSLPDIHRSAQAMALAHWMAQKAIKAQWQRQGRRWQYVEPSELHQAARQYLVEHREELIADATAMLGHLTKLTSA